VLAAAVPEWEHLCRVAMTGCDLGTVDGRRRALEQVIPVLAKIPEDSVLELYAQQVAAQVGVESSRVLHDVQSFRVQGVVPTRGRFRRSTGELTAGAAGAMRPAEDEGLKPGAAGTRDGGEGYLLGLLISRRELLPMVEEGLSPEDFQNPTYQGLYRQLCELAQTQPGAAIQGVFQQFNLEEQRALSLLGMKHYPELDGEAKWLEQSLQQSVSTLKLRARERTRSAKVASLREASDPVRRQELAAEIQALGREVEELKGVRLGT
jgi:DNA primase